MVDGGIPTTGGHEPGRRPAPRVAFVSIRAACEGLVVGVGIHAVLGTFRALVGPGVEADGPVGWLAGAALVFVGALVWGLVGGAAFVLLPSTLAFFAFARRARAQAPAPPSTLASLGLWAVLFVALVAFGPIATSTDALLLGVSLWIGVRRGFRRLAASV